MRRSSRGERLLVALLTAAFVLLGATSALLVPVLQAPDETAHIDTALHLALGDGYVAPAEERVLAAVQEAESSAASTPAADRPTWGELLRDHPGETTRVDQMTQHPPTWYLIAAGVLRAVGFEHVRWDLTVLMLRLLGVGFVAPVPLLTWMTLRRLLGSPRIAIVGAIAVLAVPQVVHIGASVSNDPPVILLGAVVTWLVARVLTGERRLPTLLGLGVAAGLAAWFKGTGLPAVPFAAIATLVAAPLAGRTPQLRRRLLDTLLVLATAGLVGAWWWVRNLVVHRTLQPEGLPRAAVPWDPGTGPDLGYFVNHEWDGVTASFWGYFGKLQYPMSPILTDLLSFAVLVAVAASFARGPHRRTALVLAVFPVVPALLLLRTNWSAYDALHQIAAAQGRYLFVALVPVVALCVIGCLRLTDRSPVLRRRLGLAVVVGAPVVALYGLSIAYRGFWEGAHTTITRTGLAHLASLTPGGRGALAVVVVLMLVSLVALVVASWRSVRDRATPEATH